MSAIVEQTSMGRVHVNATDYSLKAIEAPKYKMLRVPLNNIQSTSISIAANTAQLLEWKLPTRAYNLSKSYISYVVTIPAVAADAGAVPPVVAALGSSFEDCFELGQTVTFGQAGGIDLVNISNASMYTKVVRKIDTPLDELLSGNDDMTQLYPLVVVGGDDYVPGGYNKAVAPTYTLPVPGAPNRPVNMRNSTAVTTTLFRNRRVSLNAFTGSLLGVDRDFYSPTEMYLRVTTNGASKIAWSHTGFTTPAVTSLAFANLAISDIYLYLAVEQNPNIEKGLMAMCAAGALKYTIPFTQVFKNIGSTRGGHSNIQIQLSQQYGRRLKRIISTVAWPTETLNNSYDNANWNGEKILSYQTFMDNTPLQDRVLSCLRPTGNIIFMDDWAENRKFCSKRSSIVSKEDYQINWFHVDQFYEPRDHDTVPEVNIEEGLPMDVPRTFLFSGLTNGSGVAGTNTIDNLVHYTFAEFTREIGVSPTAGPVFI